VIDDVLDNAALQHLLEFMQEATMYHDAKHGRGYMGAYFAEGMAPMTPTIHLLKEKLQTLLPRVLGDTYLSNMWTYSHTSHVAEHGRGEIEVDGNLGVGIHADDADVNLNFWLAPDEANNDPSSGGLLVYDSMPPADWGVDDFNDPKKLADFVRQSGFSTAINVPHRQNRLVMFDSKLLHKTAKSFFKTGFENRRINFTMLFKKKSAQKIT
jgi:hypothetical protein